MLQIRLSKVGSAGDGGGGTAAKSSVSVETVTVACPDHLVLADLPVAKSLGATTAAASASSAVKSVGRRSRRHLGERVHFCVVCDFPIAIYGRLVPCEHAFCLTCARSDSSCYLCDERIQKIQTIKMMEGIFICAAPHCLKSFLKKSEFESHIHETHADLLQPNIEREGGNETDPFNISRPPSTDPHGRMSVPPESSTGRAPSRPGFSPGSSSQMQDREDKSRRNQSREQTPLKLPLQQKQLSFHGRHQQQQQPAEAQPDNMQLSQGIDRPYNWFHQPQSFEMQNGAAFRRDTDQFPPESSITEYPPLQHPQLAGYQVPMIVNPGLNPPPFAYHPFPAEGPQPYFSAPYEMPRPEFVPEGGSEQGSLLGFPPIPVGAPGFPDSYPRPWSAGPMGMPSEPFSVGQGIPDGYVNMAEQGRNPYFQGEQGRFQEGFPPNPPPVKEAELQGGSADNSDGKGVLASLPLPVPSSLPLPPPPPSHKRGRFSGSSDGGREGQGYAWQNDKRGFGNGPE